MKEILITSSVLILAVILLRLVFRGKVSRRLLYCAWLLVALRLLVPVQFGNVNFSVLTPAQPVTNAITQMEQKPVSGPSREEVYDNTLRDYLTQEQPIFRPEFQEQVDAEIQHGRSPQEVYEQLLESQKPADVLLPEVNQQLEAQVAETVAPTLGQIATAVWVIGMAVMACWFAAVNLSFRRKLRESATVLELPECKVPVNVSSAAASPCLFGLLRPTIYLTPVCVGDEKMQRHVLTHEMTHLRSGDHIWAWVRCICLCVYWFDPLVWVAASLSRRDCELACDEAVMKQLGEGERLAYGKTLLDMVSSVPAPGQLLETATAMHETKKQLKERMKCIVKKPKVFLTAAIILLMVLAVITGCTFSGAFDGPTEGPGSTTPSTTVTTGPKQLKDMTDYELLWEMAANQRTHNMLVSNAYVSDSKVIALMHFSPEFAELMTRETAADSIRAHAMEIEKEFSSPQGGLGKLLGMLSEIEAYLAEKFDPSILEDPELQKFNALFQPILAVDGKSANYYNWGVGYWHEYASVTQLSLRSLFDYGFYDEMTPTEAELTELKQHFKEVYMEKATFYRLPKDKMNAVLQTYFGITLADLPDTAFEFLTYLESTDCYYFYSMETMNMAEGFEARRVEHLSNGTIKLTYRKSGVFSGDYVVVLKPNGDGYQLLSNVYVKSQSSTTPPAAGVADIQKLLQENENKRNPYYFALGDEFSDPKEIRLRHFFDGGFEGEHTATDAEMAELRQHFKEPYVSNAQFSRLPAAKMNAELQKYFGISLADLPDSAYDGLTYLESSGCYCFIDTALLGIVGDVKVQSVEHQSNGTVMVEYTAHRPGKHVVILQPNGEDYVILSNQQNVVDDPTLAKFQELLETKEMGVQRNPYNMALGHVYRNVDQLKLRLFFEGGFDDEPEVTAAERAELGFADEVGVYRLPKEKMDEELWMCFRRRLAHMPDSAYEGLTYLESTGCYYYGATGYFSDNVNVVVKSVEHNTDGTVSVTYTTGFEPYVTAKIVTLKLVDDRYQVRSNVVPVPEELEELFAHDPKERNPYFWATGHTYASPTEINLEKYFDGGFQGEHEKTEAEREALKEIIVLWPDWVDMADFNRLPKDKMNAELEKVFGITLADLPDSAYEGLYYLESTDCYYLLQTGMTSIPSTAFYGATANDDGTVTLTYDLPGGTGEITLRPNGDSWLVVSNIQDMLYG